MHREDFDGGSHNRESGGRMQVERNAVEGQSLTADEVVLNARVCCLIDEDVVVRRDSDRANRPSDPGDDDRTSPRNERRTQPVRAASMPLSLTEGSSVCRPVTDFPHRARPTPRLESPYANRGPDTNLVSAFYCADLVAAHEESTDSIRIADHDIRRAKSGLERRHNLGRELGWPARNGR